MNHKSLIAELVERWENRIRPLSWPERVQLLQDIHDKLVADLPNRTTAEDVFSAVVAGVIDRLDEGAVTCRAQASVLAASSNPYHRALAASWRGGEAEGLAAGRKERERRGASRVPADVPAQPNREDDWVPCRIVDLSTGGTLLDATVMLAMGRERRLPPPDQPPASETLCGLATK